MFYLKLKEFNSKIKNLNILSKKQKADLLLDAEGLFSNFKNDFYIELNNRKILKKINFLFFMVDKKINTIEEFEIANKKIKILFKNDDKKLIITGQVKDISFLIEDYFFIKKDDEIYNLLYFFFLIPNNYISIQLYSYLT